MNRYTTILLVNIVITLSENVGNEINSIMLKFMFNSSEVINKMIFLKYF